MAVVIEIERGEQNIGRASAMHICPVCSKLEGTAAKSWDSNPICVKCVRVLDAMRAGRIVTDSIVHSDDVWRARKALAYLATGKAT